MKHKILKLTVPVIALILVVLYHLGTAIVIKPEESNLFVVPVTVCTVTCAVILIVQELWGFWESKPEGSHAPQRNLPEAPPFVSKNMTVLSIAAISYPVLILILGVKTATFLTAAAMLYLFGVKNKFMLAGILLGLVLTVYFLFEVILMIPFPAGLIG